MGLSLDTELRYLTSISEDGMLQITDINTKEPIFEQLLNPIGLKYMLDDKENKWLFIADGEGWVYIFEKKQYPPELVLKIQTHSKACIWSMTIDEHKLYLFVCDVNGFINTFTLGAVGKERFAKQASEMKGLIKCWVI